MSRGSVWRSPAAGRVGSIRRCGDGAGTAQTAHDYDQELLALFDAYVHGDIDRRKFLERAAKFAVGSVTAAMLLDGSSPTSSTRWSCRPTTRASCSERVEIPSPSGHGPIRV